MSSPLMFRSNWRLGRLVSMSVQRGLRSSAASSIISRKASSSWASSSRLRKRAGRSPSTTWLTMAESKGARSKRSPIFWKASPFFSGREAGPSPSQTRRPPVFSRRNWASGPQHWASGQRVMAVLPSCQVPQNSPVSPVSSRRRVSWKVSSQQRVKKTLSLPVSCWRQRNCGSAWEKSGRELSSWVMVSPSTR